MEELEGGRMVVGNKTQDSR